MNIDTVVDKDYLGKNFRALADAPVSALRGAAPWTPRRWRRPST